MYEVFKKIKQVLCCPLSVPCWIVLLFLACFCFLYYSSLFPATNTVYQDTVRTVGQLKERNESARSEIADSERHLSDAERYVDGASTAVSRSEIAAKRNAESVEQLQKLISECQESVRRQQQIIRNVDGSSRTRSETDAEN